MAEWIARGDGQGKGGYRVVVEGLLDFDVEGLEGVEERTSEAIPGLLRKSYPTWAMPWEDPAAQRVLEFEVQVRSVQAEECQRGFSLERSVLRYRVRITPSPVGLSLAYGGGP